MKTKFRPILDLPKSHTGEEIFQNKTLRPILKMQNDLLMEITLHYLKSKNITWETLKKLEPNIWFKKCFQNDLAMRNQLIGLVMGHFTSTELDSYYQFQKEMNKRIINMMIERIIDGLQKRDLPT